MQAAQVFFTSSYSNFRPPVGRRILSGLDETILLKYELIFVETVKDICQQFISTKLVVCYKRLDLVSEDLEIICSACVGRVVES